MVLQGVQRELKMRSWAWKQTDMEQEGELKAEEGRMSRAC